MKESEHTQLSIFNETTKPSIPRWSLEATAVDEPLSKLVGSWLLAGLSLL